MEQNKKLWEVGMNEYKQGFIDGLRAFAWWKNGKQVLGTSETSLEKTIENIEKVWNYKPTEEVTP